MLRRSETCRADVTALHARSVPRLGRHLSGLRDISSDLVIDPAALQMVLGVLTGWLDRREREAVAIPH